MEQIADKAKADFGARVKRLRDERGLTVTALAARMGVDYHTIMRWEKGERYPRESSLRNLARGLGVPRRALGDLD